LGVGTAAALIADMKEVAKVRWRKVWVFDSENVAM
jgi:hypothetical protein